MSSVYLNKKCEIKINEQLGRYLFATKDIKPGELILCEQPAVTGPYWGSKVCCVTCYSKSGTMCKQCRIVPLCLNCSNHNQLECDIFKETFHSSINFLIDNFDILTPLRTILLSKQDPILFESVLQMESHCAERRGQAIWTLHDINVVQPLLKVWSKLSFLDSLNLTPEDLMQKICGILDVNTFELRTDSFEEFPVRGLYPQAALLAHDCISNTFITLDSAKALRIYASVEIKPNETIYNNYTSALFGTVNRKDHLMEGKYFSCSCKRCNDPTELNTNLSSISCQKCTNGLLLPPIKKSHWKCTICEVEVKSEILEEILKQKRLEMLKCNNDIDMMEQFLKSNSKDLNPNHYLVVEMKQKLAAIIRAVCDYHQKVSIRTDPNLKKLLKRKIELCTELIPILKLLSPGISRLTGIALYEQFLSTVQLLSIKREKREIKSKEYLEALIAVESIGKESIGCLIYEPPQTPEGQLAKQAMSELKEVRTTIEKLKLAMRK